MKTHKFKGSKFNYSAPQVKDIKKFLKRLDSFKPVYFPFVKELKKKKIKKKEMVYIMHLICNMLGYSYEDELYMHEHAKFVIMTSKLRNDILYSMDNKELAGFFGSEPKPFFFDKDLKKARELMNMSIKDDTKTH